MRKRKVKARHNLNSGPKCPSQSRVRACHPIYAARETKELILLKDLIAPDPPDGGLANWIFDLERE